MKKLFFTLAICLFSFGAFASNGILNDRNANLIRNQTISSIPNLLTIDCVIEVTTIITIDHGTWKEVIVRVTYEPCPFGY